MEKVEMILSSKTVQIEYAGKVIEVNPIIGVAVASFLRNVYITYIFKNGKEEEWDEALAEFLFRKEILANQTNINFEKFTGGDSVSQVDLLVWGKLYEQVSSAILNYEIVHNTALLAVEHEIEKYKIELSTGKSISGLMEYVSGMMNEFKNLKPEDIEKMKTEATGLIEQMKQSPVANVLGESKKEKTRKKKTYVQ